LIFKIQKLGPEEDTWTYMPHNEWNLQGEVGTDMTR
jgi:hypothetical protein